MLINLILFVSLFAVVCALIFKWTKTVGIVLSVTNVIGLILSIVLAEKVFHNGPVTSFHSTFYADSLSSFMALVIELISALSSVFSVRFLSYELLKKKTSLSKASHYVALTQLFIFAMLIAVLSSSVGLMWIAIEATTIATTFLVGYRGNRKALEASWKYITICSVGVGLAFIGTIFFYFAETHLLGHASNGNSISLNWTFLIQHAKQLNPKIVKFAFGFILLGYGTKAGLVPLHSWLPDAHSQAPAPISALMSGVLITVAFYAILRFKAITDITLGRWFSEDLLLVIGLLSLLLASSLLITQKEIKRMLAYHSIEHMALIALGAAAGTQLAIAAVLLHILGHGLVKAILFLVSGEVAITEGTTEISKLKSLLSSRPILGGIFGFGLLALLGLPPFSLFISEFTMMKSEATVGLGWVVATTLILMAVIFAVVINHSRHILIADKSNKHSKDHKPFPLASRIKSSRITSGSLIIGLMISAVIGTVSFPLQSLLMSAAKVITG